MKRLMKIYKKVIMIFVLCVTMGIILFFTDRNVMISYAYTEEEKAAAKAWLSQNGYPPTMDGAQQAYQDYLNGKFGSVDGSEIPEGSVPQTPDETTTETGGKTPPVSREEDSATETKTEEKEDSSDSETMTEEKTGNTGSETKEVTQNGGSAKETKEVTQNGDSDNETKEVMQKNGTDSERKKTEQKDASGSSTKKEEKESSFNNKTKDVSQKEKSDHEITENLESSDIGISTENSEDSSVNNEINAGDLHAAKRGKISVIVIMVAVGAVVLLYFIRNIYIGNKREKCQRQ